MESVALGQIPRGLQWSPKAVAQIHRDSQREVLKFRPGIPKFGGTQKSCFGIAFFRSSTSLRMDAHSDCKFTVRSTSRCIFFIFFYLAMFILSHCTKQPFSCSSSLGGLRNQAGKMPEACRHRAETRPKPWPKPGRNRVTDANDRRATAVSPPCHRNE